MQKDNSSNEEWLNGLKSEFNQEDLAKLFNYPSIGQLFSEKEIGKLEEFFARLTVTDENLERVIRYGNQSEAEKATRASQAVKITLEFLRNLKEMQTANKK
ncbi:MAG: hypothetical protein H0X15_07620 [Acidobacteria bacterium]|jgi:hypothetical protein|nr:hypothetical protein [Acidobacteriota bacterium]MBA3785393.1 hypothetical protein [Acidobacteriota bacterium]MBA4125083.1 hypothetical protein [Acidobacteriota bacterium]